MAIVGDWVSVLALGGDQCFVKVLGQGLHLGKGGGGSDPLGACGGNKMRNFFQSMCLVSERRWRTPKTRMIIKKITDNTYGQAHTCGTRPRPRQD